MAKKGKKEEEKEEEASPLLFSLSPPLISFYLHM